MSRGVLFGISTIKCGCSLALKFAEDYAVCSSLSSVLDDKLYLLSLR